MDFKIEHYDDVLKENSNQQAWAGLDSKLIDEEFLYLEDEEADRIYKQLLRRFTRLQNQEEAATAMANRIEALEKLGQEQASAEEGMSDNGRMLQS